MADIFNTDFQDFIKSLNNAEVDYLLVGGYSVILHGYSRTTGDLDIWVDPTETNYHKLTRAFQLFGMPVFDMDLAKFLNTNKYDVFTFGRPPVSIDILTLVKGLEFDEAFKASVIFTDNGIDVRCIQYHHLITAKKASARSRDLNDIEQLSKKKER